MFRSVKFNRRARSCRLSASIFCYAVGWFAGLTGASAEDRLYDCLPVYHSVGGIVAPCSRLSAGACVVLSDKFSAGAFWHDVVRWDCTLFQYIGELCRYLLKAAPSEYESGIGLG